MNNEMIRIELLLILLGFLMVNLVAQDDGIRKFDEIKVNPFDLPPVYDLRDTTYLSDIRTQGTGGCWSSSTMVTVEAWMRRSGLGSFSLSDRNLQLNHGFDNSRNTYGNHYMATAYFSRGSGPVERLSYKDSITYLRPELPFILGEARYLPGAPDLIKQIIHDFGPVYSMLYFKRNAVDSVSNILISPENPMEQINHAVCIVGWNDTISTEIGEGVWIAQNSLGKKFGEKGFFYIPYQDEWLLKHNAVWTEWDQFDERNDIYYYDTLGSFNTYGFNDSVCYALVKYQAENDCELLRLASHINTPGTYLEFEVYSSFDEKNKMLSGKIGQTDEYLCVFPGYYTLESSSVIPLKEGQTFFILAKYNAPLYTDPLPVEEIIEDYTYPHLTTAKCWVNPNVERWPDAWYECGENTQYPGLKFDLCIRAITQIEKK